MPTEIETKIPVKDMATVEAKLKALRAEPLGEFVQDDMFFDSPDRQLLAGDRGLRLRTLEGGGSSRRYVLTYKGARQAGALKQREEIEVGLDDPQAMIEVLDRLGYRLMLHLQKRRRRYRWNDCYVELDTLPILGCFVEIEGPREALIAQVARELGMDLSQGITDSYASLLMAHARGKGLPHEPATFLLTDGR